ncbi:serine palmitoyltransferase small subunit A-like [Tubulanus polymorphus]|uniref:serine palmitoyltransferase small subunit A-like n=1 Tax=Tubulanus polymorphus TaxID=672921 RepID=UPI003DA501A6
MSVFDRISGFIKYWYFQYLLNTALYMAEPWERHIFNSILVAIIAMAVYTTYIFLPGHAIMVIKFVKFVLGISNNTDDLDVTRTIQVNQET